MLKNDDEEWTLDVKIQNDREFRGFEMLLDSYMAGCWEKEQKKKQKQPIAIWPVFHMFPILYF